MIFRFVAEAITSPQGAYRTILGTTLVLVLLFPASPDKNLLPP
jgi:hypothetical protein